MKRKLLLSLCLLQTLSAALWPSEVLQEVVVKEGDTLWSIASYYLKDPDRWPEILKYNRLPQNDPTAALPGMKLKVPVLLIKENLRKASLVRLLNDVRFRKKGQPDWKRAALNMDLYNEDGLRTLEASRADVKFYSGDVLRLDENSLVVLRPELKIEEVNLLSGAIKGARTRVITPSARVTPRSDDTVYKARIRNDNATIVQVERGSAEVMGLDTGKVVLVPAGFANITVPRQDPSTPVKAPSLPDFEVPQFSREGQIIVVPGAGASVKTPAQPPPARGEAQEPEGPSAARIEIEPPAALRAGAAGRPAAARSSLSKEEKELTVKSWTAYRIVVAKDPQFGQIVYDKAKKIVGFQRPVTDIREYDLPDGKYYRRVSYFDESGAETEPFPLPPVVLDTVPPKIAIYSPEEGSQTREGLVAVEGQTEAGCLVSINNYPVATRPDGRFSWSVVLAKEGPNKIKVTVRDPQGNRSQVERTVYLEGSKR